MTIMQRTIRTLACAATALGATALLILYVMMVFPRYPGQTYPIVVGAVSLIAWRLGAVTAASTLLLIAAAIDWWVLEGDGFAISSPEQAGGLAILICVGAVMIWSLAQLRRDKDGRDDEQARLEGIVARQRMQLEARRDQADELVHRVRNDLTTLVSIVSLYRRAGRHEEGLSALGDRVTVLGKLYQRLNVPESGDATVEMRDFLEGLVDDLRDTQVALRPVTLSLACDRVVLPMRVAAVVALTINECVTNALKYAFPDDEDGHERDGTINVTFRRGTETARLTIIDDGVGPDGGRPKGTGMGSRLLRAMASQVGGEYRLDRENGEDPVTVASLQFPIGT